MSKIKTLEIPEVTPVFMNTFEINVAKDGKHLFATHQRSLKTKAEALELYTLFSKKFPKAHGYSVSLTGYHEAAFGIVGF